jgi:hypothetical protein
MNVFDKQQKRKTKETKKRTENKNRREMMKKQYLEIFLTQKNKQLALKLQRKKRNQWIERRQR